MPKHIVSKAVGIDLGTTNSAVAIMDPTDTKIIIHTDASAETTPSCVWKNPKNGQIVVGRTAFMRLGTTPLPIRSIKRSMGKATTVRLTNEDASPEQISASILGEMKRQIEEDVAGLATNSTEWIVVSLNSGGSSNRLIQVFGNKLLYCLSRGLRRCLCHPHHRRLLSRI